MWIAAGMPWFFGNPPVNWNGALQLLEAKRIENLPRYWVRTFVTSSPLSVREFVHIQSPATAEPTTEASSDLVYA
jgi:hypothetical protein